MGAGTYGARSDLRTGTKPEVAEAGQGRKDYAEDHFSKADLMNLS